MQVTAEKTERKWRWFCRKHPWAGWRRDATRCQWVCRHDGCDAFVSDEAAGKMGWFNG